MSRLRHADRSSFETLSSKLDIFAKTYAERIRNARPQLPDKLSDRAQDNWEALVAIAECAGPTWRARAIAAALKLSKSEDDAVSPGNELLRDIQNVFAEKKVAKISSADLIQALVQDTDTPWPTYNRGKCLTPRQLAKMLNFYGIKPKTVRMGPYETPKGYELVQFADTFARYLSPQGNATPEALPVMAVSDADRTVDKHNAAPASSVRHTAYGDESPEVLAAIRDVYPNYGASPSHSTDAPRVPFDKRPDSDF